MKWGAFFQNRLGGLSELVGESVKKQIKVDRHSIKKRIKTNSHPYFYELRSIRNER